MSNLASCSPATSNLPWIAELNQILDIIGIFTTKDGSRFEVIEEPRHCTPQLDWLLQISIIFIDYSLIPGGIFLPPHAL